jgi:hypothetical protein
MNIINKHMGSDEETPFNRRTWSDTPRNTINSVISAILDDSAIVDGVLTAARGALTRASQRFFDEKCSFPDLGNSKKIATTNKYKHIGRHQN